MTTPSVPAFEVMLAAWAEADKPHCVGSTDPAAIKTTSGARAHVLERLREDSHSRDFYHACGTLGRLLARAGASPSLAASTIDGLRVAVGTRDALSAARAALVEGFVSERLEADHIEQAARWRYPHCVVRVSDDLAAICAGFPTDDNDAVVAWAEEVVRALAKMGVRRVQITGGGKPEAALDEALAVVGIARIKP